jgi:hypothetical protein
MQDAKTFAIQIFMGCVPNDTRFQLGKAERMIKERDADGIAQGRREAAEALCSLCDYISLGCTAHCVSRKAIIGTASSEKTDKGATFPPHDNDGQTA